MAFGIFTAFPFVDLIFLPPAPTYSTIHLWVHNSVTLFLCRTLEHWCWISHVIYLCRFPYSQTLFQARLQMPYTCSYHWCSSNIHSLSLVISQVLHFQHIQSWTYNFQISTPKCKTLNILHSSINRSNTCPVAQAKCGGHGWIMLLTNIT